MSTGRSHGVVIRAIPQVGEGQQLGNVLEEMCSGWVGGWIEIKCYWPGVRGPSQPLHLLEAEAAWVDFVTRWSPTEGHSKVLLLQVSRPIRCQAPSDAPSIERMIGRGTWTWAE